MTRFVKYLMIGAGACMISGIGLSAAGWAMGGEPGYWVRKDGFYTSQDIRKERAGRICVLEKTPLESFDNMDIQVAYNNIIIKPSEDDRYYMEYRLRIQKKDPEYSVKDGVLTVTCEMDPESYSSSGIAGFFVIETGWSQEPGEVTVYVPKNTPMDQVTLYNKDGQVTYDGPEAKTLNITSKYGGIDLKNPVAETASLNLSDGNLKCSGGAFTGMTVVNKYGNIDLSRITASSINIQASDGNIAMENITAGSLTAENKYGNTVCSILTADSFTAKQSDGTCTLKNADIKEGHIENKYGHISLDLTGAESDYNYDLTMKYGEIMLNNRRYDEKGLRENNGAAKNISTVSNDGNVTIRTR